MPEMITETDAFAKIIADDAFTCVVVDFTASWCGPCRMIAPTFEELAGKFSSAKFIKVDVDDASEIAENNGISAMPTFMFFKKGAKVDEMRGANADLLRSKCDQHCN